MSENSKHRAEVTAADVGLLAPVWTGTRVAHATSDAAFIAAMLHAECALAHALADHGVIPADAADSIEQAATHGVFDMVSLAHRSRSGGNPLIPLLADLRQQTAEIDADAATHVHCGATSQDIIDTALMMHAASAIDILLDDLEKVADRLARTAKRYRAAVMRTPTRHGAPTTFGLKAAGWLDGVIEATVHMRGIRGGLPAQLGGASGTLAAISSVSGPDRALEVVDSFADRLRLAAPLTPWHTDRTVITTLGDACTHITDALGRIGADVAALSRPEIDELAEPVESGAADSAATPQKHGPAMSVLINSAHRKAPALAAALHTAAAPVDERPDADWHSEWAAVTELLRLAGGASELAAELTGGLIVHTDRMRTHVDPSGGLIVGEPLMTELAGELGEQRTQALAERASAGADLRGLLADALDRDRDDQRVSELLDPARYIGAAELLIDRTLTRYDAVSRSETPDA